MSAPVVAAPVPIYLEGGEVASLDKILRARMQIKKLPFSKSTTAKDTGWKIPARAVVTDVYIEVTSNVSSSTISVGISGVTNGFLNGLSCASAGFVYPSQRASSSGGQTLGSLLAGDEIKSNDTTPYYFVAKKPYFTGSTPQSVVYVTSNHDVAGYIYIVYYELF